MLKNKKRNNHENKSELGQSFAQTSESFKKTYSNLENMLARAFRFISNWIDRILFNKRYGKLVAISLATIFCVIVNSGAEGNIFTNNLKSAVELEDVQVISNISDSTYEVSDLPETVDVTVTGDTSDVQSVAQQKSNYQILANLKDLGEGTHEVELEPVNFSSKLDVSIKPSIVVVNVKKKITRSYTLGYDYINTNNMDNIYSLSKPEFDQNEVIVRASEDRMSEIAYVKALIDVSDKKADFEQEAMIVAYDQNGEKLDVDILPETVNVKVGVSSPNKEVPIKVEFTGSLPEGRAIESYTLDRKKIRLFGSQDVLDEIKDVTIHVPLTKITEDIDAKSITVPLKLPNGTAVKGDSVTVKVDFKLGKAVSKTFTDIPIKFENWNDGISLMNDEKIVTTVEVSGTKKTVENLKATNIIVVADMSEYSFAGVYEVVLTVQNKNDLIKYSLKNIEIELVEAKVIEKE
ncbi:YbbR domain-containing protein [Breznakia sp. PF5-3]|uniref:CdaR family protein n=1 Tax=unclassified Breznakia TaxID=2623764 RepID=UPI0024061BF5|nr:MULTISPECIES: CdaR family protein [unclassified Breznakia]MDF9825441.1 YbbR domain-containing protein [Breznakia sp. PM6-1]MDF9836319.1 YbbR domain-containing protein [Breznakia sp. PF5-3]MDF9838550.1 YbbR domain-containing protein [Breznakia sp. PFB2-8]MDF9860566.1 YbbR domain-containing protein [Breznakia sp. PH5-24]